MKNLIKLFSIVFLFGAIFMSCEGPEGPAGTDGIDGVDGTDGATGTATCFVCHNGTKIETVQATFYTSQHALGDIAVDYAGGRGSCAECHSHQGFVEWSLTGDVAENFSAPEAWKCSTCHRLHTEFDSTDWTFRADDAVALAGGTSFDQGNNNLCANCHQARRTDDYYDKYTTATKDTVGFVIGEDDDDIADYRAMYIAGTIAGASDTVLYVDPKDGDMWGVEFDIPVGNVFISSTHAGPHHGPQGNMFVGDGAAASITGDVFGGHSGGCVLCHMDDNNHSFMPESATCEACHSDGTDKESDMDAVYDRLVAIAQFLDGIHAIHIDDSWTDGDALFGNVHPMYASITRNQFQAFWNFMYMMEDRSLSAHNPTFYEALLSDCETKLGL